MTTTKDSLESIKQYDILDTPPEEEFDAITRLAAEICETPVAMINFVDESRFWNKSSVGLDIDLTELPRSETVCNHTIQERHKLVIEDLSNDERFKNYSYVRQQPHFRFYAGITIKSADDHNIGTLCVFDKECRTLTEKQEQSLEYLAKEISTRLELRRKRKQLTEQNQELHDQAWFLKNTADLMFQVDPDSASITSARNGNKETIGFTNNELEGKHLFDVFEQIEPEQELRNWMAGAQSTDEFEQEAMLVTKKGKEIWCKIVATKNEESIYLTARNITEKHAAREKLVAESELNQKLVQNLPGIFCLFNEDGEIISWNKNFLEQTGFSENQIKNNAYYNNYFQPYDGDADIKNLFNKAIEHGEVKAECSLKTESGDTIPILMSGFRVDYSDRSQAVAVAIDLSEQKRAEQELENEKLRFELATKAASDVIWDRKFNGNDIWWSEGLHHAFGYERNGEERGLSWWENQVHPDDRKSVITGLDKFFKSDKIYWSDSYRFKKADDRYAFVKDTAYAIRNETGQPLRLIGAMVDETEQMEARKELTQALKQLHKAQEIAQIGYFEWHPKEDKLDWSDETVHIFGVEEKSGFYCIQDFLDLIPPLDMDKVKGMIQQNLRGEDVNELIHRIITPAGEEKYVKQRVEATLDQEGAPAIISGTVQDVTQEVEQRKKLERFSKVVTETSNFVVITDPAGNIEWVNNEFQEMTGYSLEEAKGKKPGELLQGPDSDPEVIAKMSEKISAGEPVTVEIINYTKAGEPYWVEISIDPVFDDNGKIEEFFAIQKDITQRKKSEKELRKSLDEKQVLLAEIHHRVKNNMAIISGLLELEASQSDDEELGTKLRESQMRIQSMAMIHEKLYESQDFTNLSFAQYVTDLVDSIQRTYALEEQGISIDTDIEPITMNINQAIPCGLLLHELLTNVVKHGFGNQQYTTDGHIIVGIKQTDNFGELIIRDNGVGVPEGFSLENKHTLGATLIKTLLKQLEADLEINSGETTIFTIRFELNEDKQGASANADLSGSV